MTTFTIDIRGHGMIWRWHGVTGDEMQALILAMEVPPDGVDDEGMFVEFTAGIPYRNMRRLSPELVERVLGRAAWSCLKDRSEGYGG